jgi:hypothetical protein
MTGHKLSCINENRVLKETANRYREMIGRTNKRKKKRPRKARKYTNKP